MLQAELAAGVGEPIGLVAGAVVGQDAADGDAEPVEPGDGGGQVPSSAIA